MNRFFVLFSALALLLCLSACGGSGAADSSSDPGSSSGVYTDWSKLTDYQSFSPVGSQWYHDLPDVLIPNQDYGDLIPYNGNPLSYSYSWCDENNVENIDSWDVSLYGLMTLDGKMVTDTVFSNVYRLSNVNPATYDSTDLPVWVLSKTIADAQGVKEQRYALAGEDGSWCTDFVFSMDEMGLCSWSGGIFLALADQSACVMLDLDGKELFRWERDDFVTPGDPSYDWWAATMLCYCTWSDGIGLVNSYNNACYYVDAYTGKPLDWPTFSEAYAFSEGLAAVRDPASGHMGFIDSSGAWVLDPIYFSAGSFQDGRAVVTYVSDTSVGLNAVIDRDGNELMAADQQISLKWQGSYYYVEGDGWYNLDFHYVPQYIDEHEVSCGGDFLWYYDGTSLFLLEDGNWTTFPATLASGDYGISERIGENLSVYRTDAEGNQTNCLYSPQGDVLIPFETYDYFYDMSDKSSHTWIWASTGNSGGCVLDENGKRLFSSTSDSCQLYHDLFSVSDEVSYGVRNADGDWILCLPAAAYTVD